MLSKDMASRMQEILRKHAEGYRRDLPEMIAQMQAHVAQLGDGGSTSDCLHILQREAHDMKGQAATFGLLNISVVAQSLSCIVDRSPEIGPALIEVLNTHVSVLKALLEADDQHLVETALEAARSLG